MLYRLEKAGVAFSPKFDRDSKTWAFSFSNIVDTLHACISYRGTHEELAEGVFDIRDQVSRVLLDAWGNLVLPTIQGRAAAAQQQQAASEKPV